MRPPGEAEVGGFDPQHRRTEWENVFYELSRLDGEVEEGKEPSINIKKLKQHFRSEKSYQVRADS